ncbi:MAG: hypothetical protein RL757_1563, partial [Bacteroidota bacterium]
MLSFLKKPAKLKTFTRMDKHSFKIFIQKLKI